MDYLQLLYLQPVQKLPILLLVSEERNTGKSTFLNFLKAIFQDNVTFNTNEDFRSQFNSDWAGKLLIMVDEVLLNRREDSERLKNLSTTLSYKVEAKGKDRNEIGFFAKFVLCSNNEHLPVIIDAGETRYWVRKIEQLQCDDTDFLQKLKDEIPAFLYYLQHRTMATKKESRMWFSLQQIETEALRKIIRSNRNRLEIEMADLLLDIMAKMEVETVSFCLHDIIPPAAVFAGQGGEAAGEESGAGVLETVPCTQRAYLYHLRVWRRGTLSATQGSGQVLHRDQRTAGKPVIFC